MALITVEQAVAHLRPAGDYNPDDLQLKMVQAEALVLDYLKIDEDALEELAWDTDTDPAEDRGFAIAKAAILEVLTNLYFDRGDRDDPTDGPLTERVKRALSMRRDPSIA